MKSLCPSYAPISDLFFFNIVTEMNARHVNFLALVGCHHTGHIFLSTDLFVRF